jgi:hypothetical protein
MKKPLCCGKMKNLTPPDQKKLEKENSLLLKRKNKSHVHCTLGYNEFDFF